MFSFKKFNTINEGVYDKAIFKAFFIAGGTGSGKTYTVDKSGLKSYGLKNVSSDIFFEYLMNKENLSLKLDKFTEKEMENIKLIRDKAKDFTDNQMNIFLQGKLGLIIDGTGKDYEKIKNSAEKLNDIGYDCYMIFVNTSLDVALERNNQRPRSVPENVVKKSWKEVQNNIGKFQNYFGQNNFIIIDNNNPSEEVFTKIFKRITKLINEPVKNIIAKRWIEKELQLKKKENQ